MRYPWSQKAIRGVLAIAEELEKLTKARLCEIWHAECGGPNVWTKYPPEKWRKEEVLMWIAETRYGLAYPDDLVEAVTSVQRENARIMQEHERAA